MQSKTVVRVEAEEPAKRLAVLIDADNAQAGVIEGLLEEVARFGEASVRRIYGDFTSPNSASWQKVLNRYSIKPVQQFAYTTGKNATDSTMIIDAMDLLMSRAGPTSARSAATCRRSSLISIRDFMGTRSSLISCGPGMICS